MAISLRHAFNSAKADGTDSTLVQPSNWNAEHALTLAGQRLLGRGTAGNGAAEEIVVSARFALTAGNLDIAANSIGGAQFLRAAAGQVWTANGAGADPGWAAAGGTTFATAAQYRNNTAGSLALSPEQVWTASAEVAPTFGATVTLDLNSGFNFAFTATSNFTLANPTNAKVGQSGYIRIQQDATGSRTITFGTAWDFPLNMSKALSTAANSVDVLFYTVRSSTEIFCSLNKGMA
jgi:hypothetical protein